MLEGAVRIAIVGEDHAHRMLGMFLLDAVLRERAVGQDWFDLESARCWCGPDSNVKPAERFFKAKERPDPTGPGGRPLSFSARIDGKPPSPAVVFFRKLIHWMQQQHPTPDLVVILSDTDGGEAQACGAALAMALHAAQDGAPALAIGAPHQDAEAWALSGWKPKTSQEKDRLDRAREALCFNPTHEPHRLTAGPNHAPTDAKRVLRFMRLAEGDRLDTGHPDSNPPSPDELLAMLDAPTLLAPHDAHRACGLAAFIEALRVAVDRAFLAHLPPAFG